MFEKCQDWVMLNEAETIEHFSFFGLTRMLLYSLLLLCRILHNCHDDASKFICLLAKPNSNYLEQEDFIPILQVCLTSPLNSSLELPTNYWDSSPSPDEFSWRQDTVSMILHIWILQGIVFVSLFGPFQCQDFMIQWCDKKVGKVQHPSFSCFFIVRAS